MPFTTKQRQIYTYSDGSREVRADPMVLLRRWRAAAAKLTDVEAILPRLGFVDPDDPEAIDPTKVSDDVVLDALAKVCPAIQTAFGVKAMTGDEGLTEWEQVTILGDFFVWLDESKKAAGSSPRSSTSSPGSAPGAETLPPSIPTDAVSMETGPTATASSSASG